MAIGLEEKKSSLLQKILIALFVVAAVFALFFFGSKTDLFKKTGQADQVAVSETKKINIDFDFLSSLTLDENALKYSRNPTDVKQLQYFPSFPSFFASSSSSSPVSPGRENPFTPYSSGTASNKQGTASGTNVTSKTK